MSEALSVLVGVTAALWALLRLIEGRSPMIHYDPAIAWLEGHVHRPLLPKVRWKDVRLPVEPRNAWSNVTYMVVGLAVAGIVQTRPAYVFAATMAALYVGSFLMHATLTAWGKRADHGGMYAAFGALSVYTAGALGMIPEDYLGALMFVAAIASGVLFNKYGREGTLNLIMGALLAPVIVAGLARGHWILTGLMVIVFGVSAYLSLRLDKKLEDRVAANPEAASTIRGFHLWLHALWHNGTAVAMGLAFLAVTP